MLRFRDICEASPQTKPLDLNLWLRNIPSPKPPVRSALQSLNPSTLNSMMPRKTWKSKSLSPVRRKRLAAEQDAKESAGLDLDTQIPATRTENNLRDSQATSRAARMVARDAVRQHVASKEIDQYKSSAEEENLTTKTRNLHVHDLEENAAQRDDNGILQAQGPYNHPFIHPPSLPPSSEIRSVTSRTGSSRGMKTYKSTSPKGTKRDSSPSKVNHVGDLRRLIRRPQIQRFELDEWPDHVGELWTRLEHVSVCNAVLPSFVKQHKSRLMSRIPTHDAWYYEPRTVITEYEQSRQLETGSDIAERSVELQELSIGESEWNSEVHREVFNLALRQHPSLIRKDVTAVPPDDAYVPMDPDGQFGPKNKVDIALLCRPGLVPVELVEKALGGHRCINHVARGTQDRQLLLMPIAVLLETKVYAGPTQRALAQLASCAMMSFSRMREMIGDSETVIEFPLVMIMVIGPRWIACLARDGKESTTISQCMHDFGDTGSPRGVFQVLAGLDAIMGWVEKHWAPWYRTNCLGNAECFGRMCVAECLGEDVCEPVKPWKS
jgi:hypothetical protein